MQEQGERGDPGDKEVQGLGRGRDNKEDDVARGKDPADVEVEQHRAAEGGVPQEG